MVIISLSKLAEGGNQIRIARFESLTYSRRRINIQYISLRNFLTVFSQCSAVQLFNISVTHIHFTTHSGRGIFTIYGAFQNPDFGPKSRFLNFGAIFGDDSNFGGKFISIFHQKSAKINFFELHKSPKKF